MATARSFWKGHLRLALVTIPIRLVSATASEDKIALHQVDRKSKQRIRYQKVAGETGKVVPQSDIVQGYEASQLDPAPDVVVVGNVMSRGKPVIEALLERNIPYMSGPEWLSRVVLHDRWVLAVAGTHGKTTTTSMLAHILDHAGLDPGFLIGGVPGNFEVSARLGSAARILDRATVAVTAEGVGAAEATVALCVKYAKERVQFDSPIGRYQGVKHPLAEMHVDVESFKSLLYYAAWALDESPAEVPRSASLAKAYASDAFARIGIDGVQLHGAVGYTAEYDIQLYLKRSKWARPAFGDADFHYERVAALGGL